MRKVFVLAATVAALASCAKNEVVLTPSSEKAEISYNVAPKTKSLSTTQSDFSQSNVFASWAYYLPKGKNWAANSADAKDYIVNSTISYQTAGNWKETNKSYYWPKDGGSLTFFAYSLNKSDLTLSGNNSIFTCYKSTGVAGAIDLDDNKNTDFLVADIAKDKTANEQKYTYNGVPTLFRHRLSRVACTVVKAEEYQNKKFELTAINFVNVSHYGNYTQTGTPSTGSIQDATYKDFWLPSGTKVSEVYTPATTGATQVITTTKSDVASENVVIYMPQSFADNADAKIQVIYTITTTVGDGEVVENCEFTAPLKTVFPNNWEMGKKYTVNLTFSLDEITWDPAVEDWDNTNSSAITVS